MEEHAERKYMYTEEEQLQARLASNANARARHAEPQGGPSGRTSCDLPDCRTVADLERSRCERGARGRAHSESACRIGLIPSHSTGLNLD
eukprot:scaffold704_cov347-Prasinococcus_capsulatus_cf.AAC.24